MMMMPWWFVVIFVLTAFAAGFYAGKEWKTGDDV